MATIENAYYSDDDLWSAPARYIHKVSDICYEAYESGPSRIAVERTYEEAARHLFPVQDRAGYALEYFHEDNDGDFLFGPLCADCALNAFLADPLQPLTAEQIEPGETTTENDIDCAVCESTIAHGTCFFCNEPVDRTESFLRGTRGMYQAHAACVAAAMLRGDAHKSGKGEYTTKEVEGDWYHRRGAETFFDYYKGARPDYTTMSWLRLQSLEHTHKEAA